jgi:hypothetical protein
VNHITWAIITRHIISSNSNTDAHAGIVAVQATVSHVVHSILSIAFVMATAGVIFNVKARMVKETAWQVRSAWEELG